MARTFEDYEAAAATKPVPLIVGVTGPQASGKTYSAHRLAAGMARAVGGKVFGIDTESDRMLHYKNDFAFQHVPFAAPHSPADYEAAIEHCLNRGARVILIDSMTHEHSGEGGYLEMHEAELDRMAGSDWQKRDKCKWTARIAPAAARRRLNRKIVSVGARCFFILCYRAEDKTKPTKDGKAIHLGWQAETTSKLPYDMTVRFLLPPGSDGRPSLKPDTEFEALQIKNPGQFREWFKPGFQLTEEIGEKLARWALGGTAADPKRALLDAIRDELARRHPGDAQAAKDNRAAAIGVCFGVRGWKAVEALPADRLEAGLTMLRGPAQTEHITASDLADREPGSDDEPHDLFEDERRRERVAAGR